MWSHRLAYTVSGEWWAPLELESSSWSQFLNAGVGSGTSTLRARSSFYSAWSRDMFRELLLSPAGRFTLVGLWDDVPVWGHPVMGADWQPQSGVVSLHHRELGGLLSQRYFFPASERIQPTRYVEFGNRSTRGMLTAVVQHVTGGGASAAVPSAGASRRLPVWFSEQPQPGGWTRRSYQHEFTKPWSWMQEIADLEVGPDWWFAPGTWSGSDDGSARTAFQWVYYVGQPLELSRQEHHLHAPESGLLNPEIGFDGGFTGLFGLGSGMGVSRPASRAYRTGGGVVPERVGEVAFSTDEALASVQNRTVGAWARLGRVAESWSLTMRAETVLPGLSQGGLRPGSRLVIHTDDDLVLLGRREFLVSGMSGDLSGLVTVEVQPV